MPPPSSILIAFEKADVISALNRLRQVHFQEFEASLVYIVNEMVCALGFICLQRPATENIEVKGQARWI